MLALSRKPGESVIIGNDIELTILEVKGEQVKVGIKAPKSVAIYRKELFEQRGFPCFREGYEGYKQNFRIKYKRG